jgi:ABC-type nitrate/sulfonate/bicarbonate transport system substrate-binding protein
MASLIPVRIAYAALGSGSAPVWCAKEAGIFADEGLDAQVLLVRGSGRVAEAMLNNEIQFANVAAPLVVAANLKGGDLVYLTGGVNWLIQSIIARAEIRTPAQLRGHTFGVSHSGGVDTFLVDYLLKPHGVTSADMKQGSIDNQPDAIAKMDRGEIDAALFSPPYSFEALKHGHRVLLDSGDYHIDYQLGGIIARRSYVEQNQLVAEKVVRAYVHGVHRYKTDIQLALGVFKKYSLIEDDGVARQCYHAAKRHFQPKPYPSVPGLQRVLAETGKVDGAAGRLRVEDMMDCRWLAELDNNGFIAEVYSSPAAGLGGNVLDTLQGALESAGQTKRGQLALNGHDEDFQIEIDGQAPIHVEIRGGNLAVRAGPSPRQEPLRFTRVQLDGATLEAIIGGRLSPVAAMEQGKLYLRTRLYGGALITILLRASYDLARDRRLGAEE